SATRPPRGILTLTSLDFCFLSSYLDQTEVMPPTERIHRHFSWNCTMRPTAQSRNTLISLISQLEYFYAA
ncbi:MAG: hypothetical protein WBM44_18290, partial [Waterburya sp.]